MDVNDVLVFTRVAQAGSFSRAAKLLHMPVSTVSRRVAELERELGIPLMIRTTRSLKITEMGRTYLEHGQAIAAELEKAEALATSLLSVPQGTLRITAATDFGNQFLGPVISEFLKIHSRVKFDVVLTERVVDLIEEGFDLAIRMGELSSSSLVSRKIGSLQLQLYASPSYLKINGEPKTCAELSGHECILFTGEGDYNRWSLKGPKGERTVQISGKIASNDMTLIRDFAISGRGIALMPHFICRNDVEKGRLKVVLEDWANASGPIHVVYPSQRFLLPKVRVFVDHLVASCAKVQWRYQEKK